MGNKINKHKQVITPGAYLKLSYNMYNKVRIGDVIVYNKELYIVRGTTGEFVGIQKLVPKILDNVVHNSDDLMYYTPDNLSLFQSQLLLCTWTQYQRNLNTLYAITSIVMITDNNLHTEVLRDRTLYQLYHSGDSQKRLALDRAYSNLLQGHYIAQH